MELFKNQFTCLGETTEKYLAFTVPIKKEVTRIDNNGEEITKINLQKKKEITKINLLIPQDLWQAHY